MKEISFADFEIIYKSGVNVFSFGAPWCKDCKKAEPMLKELAKEFCDICFYEINVDKNDGVRDLMSIRHIPTILFVKDGVEVCKRVVEPQSIEVIKECILKLRG